MKKLLLILTIAITFSSCGISQNTHNVDKNGFVAEGYDVTAYFEGSAQKGNDTYVSTYDGAKYKFMNEANKEMFDNNPTKFAPKYGGYCAYAVGDSNSKVDINPKSFLIEDGQLYLFYDTIFADTKEKWLEENPEALKKQADINWITLKDKN